MLGNGSGSKQTDGNEAKFNWHTCMIILYLIPKHNFTNMYKNVSAYMNDKGQIYQS